MIENLSSVYCILNKVNKKKYIGSTKNLAYRFGAHFSQLRNNKHRNKHLQNAVNKYGIENFSFEILELVNESKLLIREQFYIDINNWDILYNKTKIAGSGGGDFRRKSLYLLDLKGNIVKKFNSGVETAKYLKVVLLEYDKINTKSIKKKKYRIVTVEFYEKNIKEIKSWRAYSNKTKHTSEIFHTNKYFAMKNDKIYGFKTLKPLGTLLNMTHQRISQIFQLIENQELNKYFHKKSGFYLTNVRKNL